MIQFLKEKVFSLLKIKKNEFESMYYDEESKGLVMICKDCEADKKNSVSAWSFDPASGTYTPSAFSIDVDHIAKKNG